MISPLDDDQHLVRHVPPARQIKDPDDDSVIGIFPQAFELNRAKEEEYLSAAWLEYHGHAERKDNLAAIIADFQKARQIKPSHRFAIGQVGAIKQACDKMGQQVRVSHEPVCGFDSHASVRRYNSDNAELLALLAAEAWAELVGP